MARAPVSTASASTPRVYEQGIEFPVNSYTTESQFASQIAMDDVGNFVVTWISVGQDGPARARLLSDTMLRLFRRGMSSRSIPARPAARGLDAWRWMTTATSLLPGQAKPKMAAALSPPAYTQQRIAPTGATLGDEFLVNTFTTSTQNSSQVAMDSDGDFVVTWGSRDQDIAGYGVYAQRRTCAIKPRPSAH